MKNLISYIKESLLDDEDVLMKNTGDKVIKNEIRKYLKENYNGRHKISGTSVDGKYIVDCSHNLWVKNKYITSLTNEYFEFGEVGSFDCSTCFYLTSLKGAPKVVRGNFNCSGCDRLISLESAPKVNKGDFNCSFCRSLTSLEGSPKEVGKSFYCNYCDSLTHLKGAPKEVGRNFYCDDCKTRFFTDDVEKVSKVKGEIIC